jgi:hypothetical protein
MLLNDEARRIAIKHRAAAGAAWEGGNEWHRSLKFASTAKTLLLAQFNPVLAESPS